MSASAFDQYKVDHLFLLIGENPLPNYVAAQLLLKDGGTPYLVYTNGTEAQAKRVQKILGEENSTRFKTAQLVSLEDYESDAYQIQRKIQEKVKKLTASQIGLNYTGGTKAMAVHAYRSIAESNKEQGRQGCFSYLDPRRLKMHIDNEGGLSNSIPIRAKDLTISLETIFELHGRKCKHPPMQTPLLLDLTTKFAEVNQDSSNTKAWFYWFYSIFCEGDSDPEQAARKPKKASGKTGNWKPKTELEKLSFPTICLPNQIIDGFSQQGFIELGNNHLSLKLVKDSGQFKDLQDFCKWLDGTWLEHYLLKEIASIADQANIASYGMNFEVPLAGTRDGFEFDVAFTYGYQLFAISCTTSSDRGLCKSKLFEAFLRSQQMGGGEARVALLCFDDNLDSLKAEMADLLSEKQIRIFGRQHLLHLADEIKYWIQDNDAELDA